MAQQRTSPNKVYSKKQISNCEFSCRSVSDSKHVQIRTPSEVTQCTRNGSIRLIGINVKYMLADTNPVLDGLD